MKTRFIKSLLLLLLVITPSWLSAQRTDRVKLDSLLKLLPAATADTNKVNVEINLGSAYSKLKITDSASYYLQLALQLAEKLKWQKGIAKSYYHTGIYFSNLTKPDYNKAQYYMMQAFELSFKIRDYGFAYQSAQTLSWLLNGDQKKIPEVISYLKSVAGRFKQAGQPTQLAGTFLLIGDCYQTLFNYSDAIDYYNKALALEAEDHRSYIESNHVLAIAYLYTHLHDTEKARAILLKTKVKYLKAGDQQGLANTYLALAESFDEDRNYKAAINCYSLAVQMDRDINNSFVSSNAENAIGWDYFLMKDYNSAYKHVTRSLTLTKNDSSLLIYPLSSLASIYRDAPVLFIKKIGLKPGVQYQKALALLQQCETYAVAHGNSVFAVDILKELSLTYEKMNLTDDAFKTYKAYITQRDSTDSLKKEKAIALKEAQSDFSHKEDSLKYNQNITNAQLKQKKLESYFFIAGIGGLLILSVVIGLNYNNQKKSNRLLSIANTQISYEKTRSDVLLLNILPADVAEELKENGSASARQFDNVTVLFTDFVNFTTISELLTPQELVDELHCCFKVFDGIMVTHHIEKIKTIGDAYLAVAALPNADIDHAVNAIKAALDIKQFIHLRKKQLGDKTFDIRIGIHSGSVVAGIVGVNKFAYDVWGDTVNTAARMEQNSKPGKINVSEKTYELVKDQFEFTYRGEIEAKNKGFLKMYFAETLV